MSENISRRCVPLCVVDDSDKLRIPSVARWQGRRMLICAASDCAKGRCCATFTKCSIQLWYMGNHSEGLSLPSSVSSAKMVVPGIWIVVVVVVVVEVVGCISGGWPFSLRLR